MSDILHHHHTTPEQWLHRVLDPDCKESPLQAMDAGTQSFQNVLTELRSTKIGNSLPSPAEILHGRSLITGQPVTVVLGERCWGTGTNNIWTECYITGIDEDNRCYQVVFEDTSRILRHTKSHLKPCGPDFPHISEQYLQQNPNLVTSEGAIPGEKTVSSGGEGENHSFQMLQ